MSKHSAEKRIVGLCARLILGLNLAAAVFAQSAVAQERELANEPAPSSVSEIEAPIEKVFPAEPKRPPSLFPSIRKRLQKLPPFFADTQLEARLRTYYQRLDRVTDILSEDWAVGGSLYYRSGWFKDVFGIELEGFTSQPVWTPDDQTIGTGLLAPNGDGYSVLGIANANFRFAGMVLTAGRLYLDEPYLNRNDSRMTPNTFEGIKLVKPEGELKFTAGYTSKIKFRNSDEFVSMTEFIGLDEDHGLAHGGVVWDPKENFSIGAIGQYLPDVFGGIYSELRFEGDLTDNSRGRLDTQGTYEWDSGDNLLNIGNTWNLGLRGSLDYKNAMFRLGFSITGPNTLANPFGSSPSYVNLMQRTFNRAEEKAFLASFSYDFSHLGVEGLSSIVNFVAAFDGKVQGVRHNAREVDATIDYRVKKGLLKSFWLRVRGSWLTEESRQQDGLDVRVILRYDIPVI